MKPAKPPLPTPSYLPFHADAGGSQSSKRMSEPAVGLMVPSTRQNGTDNETNCGGTCAMMLNGGLILPAAVTEASPIFMPARLLQLAASACPVPNEWKASQTKAAAVVRSPDRMVSPPPKHLLRNSSIGHRAPGGPANQGDRGAQVGCELEDPDRVPEGPISRFSIDFADPLHQPAFRGWRATAITAGHLACLIILFRRFST
jgi:hypothetical protein